MIGCHGVLGVGGGWGLVQVRPCCQLSLSRDLPEPKFMVYIVSHQPQPNVQQLLDRPNDLVQSSSPVRTASSKGPWV
jgi:hypothetical protein